MSEHAQPTNRQELPGSPKPEPSIHVPPDPQLSRLLSADPNPEKPKETYPFFKPPTGPDEIGRIGDYRVLKMLGSGGMGIVFQAEDLTLKRPVALKVMRPELQSDPDSWQRVLREARTMASVRHEHLITVYQAGKEGEVIFLAMELLQGEALDDRFYREPMLQPAEILRIGKEVAKALGALHAQGLVHRDIKPSNIWLEAPNEKVKVLDFGLARETANSDITQTGHVLGTPAYMSPEQARAEILDGRADLFSLGCVLYFLSTGRTPFMGKTLIAQLTALAMDTPQPVEEIQPAIGKEFSYCIMKLLAKSREDRHENAAELVKELELLEKEFTTPSAPSIAAPVAQFTPHVTTMRRLPVPEPNKATPGANSIAAAITRGHPIATPQPVPQTPSPTAPTTQPYSWLIAVAILVIFSGVIFALLRTPPPRSPGRITDEGEGSPIALRAPKFLPSPATPNDLKVVLPPNAIFALDGDFGDMDGVFFPSESKKVGRFQGEKPPNAFETFGTRGATSPHAIGMHASPDGAAFLKLKLNGKFAEFHSVISLNEGGPTAAENPMYFGVYGDGKLLWEGQPFRKSSEMQKCAVDVKGVKVLELRLDLNGERPRGAHALWFEPYLIKAASAEF